MKERLTYISKLLKETKTRAAYIKAKLDVLVPSQIRALRLNSDMPRQSDLAKAAAMQQSRISMFETPGAANMTLDTLAWLAAIFKVGLIVKFVPFSEMLRWENSFSQDEFIVTRLSEDQEFLHPELRPTPALLQRSKILDFEQQQFIGAAANYGHPMPTGMALLLQEAIH